MYRRSFLCTLAVAGALTLAPAAHAAGWAGSPPLSPSDHVASNVRVALLPDGSRVVAWIDQLPNRLPTENVSVRVAPPTGAFGPAQTFAGDARDLQLVTGDDGTAALAWATRDERIHVARRAPGESAFTEATPLRVSEGQSAISVDAVVAGGAVYVAYDSFATLLQTTKSSIHAGRLAAGDTALRELVGTDGGLVARETYTSPAPQRSVDSPHIAAKPDGTLAVAYEHRTDAPFGGGGHGFTGIAAATLMSGSPSFGITVSLKLLEGTSSVSPPADIATAAGGGHRYVVWDSGFRTPIGSSDLDAGFTAVTLPADPATSLQAGADGQGNLLVGSTGLPSPDAFQDVIDASVTAAGAQPASAKRITALGLDRRIDDFVVASDGTALAIANLDTFGFRSDPEALLRRPGGDFGPVEHVAGLQDVPESNSEVTSAAVAPGGRAIVAWAATEHTGTVNSRVHVSERDTTPPGFGTIDAPESAVVGEPAGFAAAASDTLSGTTLSWDFGDGSRADGNVVSHTFGEPGPATVTVTATDEQGNSVSQSRVVAVKAAPVKPDDGPGDPPSDPPPPADTISPSVTGAKFTNASFRVTNRPTAVLARARKTKAAPAGTTLRLNVSERSTVVVAFARARIVRGTLVRASVAPGAVAIPFSGRLGKTALPAGSYTATITAIDGAGNRSKAVIVKFKIVKK